MRMLLVSILVVLVVAVVGEDVGRPHIEFPAGTAGGMELVQSEYNQFAPQHHGGGEKQHHAGGGKKHHRHEEEVEAKKKLSHVMHRWGWHPSPEQVSKLYSRVQPHKHHHEHHKSGHKSHHEEHHHQGEGEKKKHPHPGGKEEKHHHEEEVEKKHRHHEEKAEEEKKLLHWMHHFGWNPSPEQLNKLYSLGHSHHKQQHAHSKHPSEYSKDGDSAHHSGHQSGDRSQAKHGTQESQPEPPAWKSLGPIPGQEVHLHAHLGILPPGYTRPRSFGDENPSPPRSSSSSVSAANAPLPAPGHVATSTATNRTVAAPPAIGQPVLTQTPSVQAAPTMGNATSGSLGPSSTQPPAPPAGPGGMIAGIPVVDGADAKDPPPRVVNSTSTSAASFARAEGWVMVAAIATLVIVA